MSDRIGIRDVTPSSHPRSGPREEAGPLARPTRMPRTAFAASLLFALAQLACERGHYASRDHAVAEPSTGGESQSVSTSETASEQASSEGASTPSGATTTTSSETSTDQATSENTSSDDSQTTTRADETRGHAPEEEMARAQVLASLATTLRVHTTSGPITRAVAERALAMQRMRIDHCYRTVIGPDAAGSMRASIHVEASGAARAELETMAPELDRVLPCVDAALERAPFPASSDGRPTHVVAEIARTP